MPIEKILIEYAKLHLQIVALTEQISELQQQIKSLTEDKTKEQSV